MFHVKPFLILLSCLLASLLAFESSGHQQANPSTVSASQPAPEGCSSCPPADALLAKLAAQQPISGAEIVALEEHVDYWNQQGWTDPFSSDQWTARQQKYASARRDEQIYTPQMVINGSAQFVGSREGEARREIQQAALQ